MPNATTSQKFRKPLMLAVLVLAMLCLFVGCSNAAPKNEAAGTKSYTLTVVDAEGKETVHELSTDAEMLGAALLDAGLIEGSESEYGLFVTKVDGMEANSANEEWWCLTKGGEAVMTGVDSTPVADGDKFEFTLTVGY